MIDFTATTILQRFQDEKAAQSVERVLKKLAAKKAVEMLKVCAHSVSGSKLTSTDTRTQASFAYVHLLVPLRLPSS